MEMMSYVRVFMIEDEALFSEWEDDRSQQGSCTNDTYPMARPTDCVGSSAGAGPSGVVFSAEDVEIKHLGSFESRGEG